MNRVTNPYVTASNPLAVLVEYVVYDYEGITYVPHYRNSSIFVGPGYPKQNKHRYSDKELQMLGAKPRVALLWQRENTSRNNVSDLNP